jgi:hypothetical protein
MKKMILALLLAGFATSQVQTAKAGGWGIAAAAVGGVAAGAIIAESVSHPVYCAPAPAYYAPSPAYYYAAPLAPAVACPAPAPAPAVVYAQPAYVYAPAPVVTFGFGFGPWHRGFYDRHDFDHHDWHRR